ncbi:hypothetical protein [Mesorhizobium sp. M0244]
MSAKQRQDKCQPDLKARSAPADVIVNAVGVMRIATGEKADDIVE